MLYVFILHSVYCCSCCPHADQALQTLPAAVLTKPLIQRTRHKLTEG